MSDQPNILDTQIREAIRSEVRAAMTEVMADIPNTTEVHQMIERRLATGLAGVSQIVDAKLDTYTNETITPLLDMVKGIPREINDLKVTFATLQGRIDQVLTGFTDIKTTQARLDSGYEQVRDRQSKQNERTTKVESAIGELRRDIFGTPDPDGPPSFAQLFRTEMHNTQTMITNYQTAMVARMTATETKVNQHAQWIEARQKAERFITQGAAKVVKGIGGMFTRKAVLTLLLGGGALGIIMLLLEYLDSIGGGLDLFH